jgi:SM-20-related protein
MTATDSMVEPQSKKKAAPASSAWLDIAIVENFLDEDLQARIGTLLNTGGWNFGWKSKPSADTFCFWHKHFAGARFSDHKIGDQHEDPYDCAAELAERSRLLYKLWQLLEARHLPGHRLVRCYANGTPFGSEGMLHTDSIAPNSFTSVYYPHTKWSPDWAGETVFFNADKTDIIQSVYPRPNRLVMFRGVVPHVARGVSRTCPVLRVTLMFKTELPDD